MKKVVFILGPTAVGKSAVAVKLAQIFDGEIISADSVQIFKGLDIGSAKITEKEMCGIVHHGIDICNSDQEFSAFEFAEYTLEKIEEICSRKKVPIVVGGTGLYIRALVEGYNFGGVEKDTALRESLEKLCKEKGVQEVFKILQAQAPDVAQKIDKNNPVRVIRAIEIAKNKGEKAANKPKIAPLVIGITLPREKLYEKINQRVDVMLESGLVKEVQELLKSGLTAQNQSMHAIGYKEVVDYLNGEIGYDRMVELVKQHSRNYAKRQLTFLRSMNCPVVDMTDNEKGFKDVENLVENFLR